MSNPSSSEPVAPSPQNEHDLLNSAVNDFISSSAYLKENSGDIACLGKEAAALSRCARIIVLPVASPQSNGNSSGNVGASVNDKYKASFLSAAVSFLRTHLSSACAAVSENRTDESGGNAVDTSSQTLVEGTTLC
jgi:hypothetical protein